MHRLSGAPVAPAASMVREKPVLGTKEATVTAVLAAGITPGTLQSAARITTAASYEAPRVAAVTSTSATPTKSTSWPFAARMAGTDCAVNVTAQNKGVDTGQSFPGTRSTSATDAPTLTLPTSEYCAQADALQRTHN